MTDPHHRTGVTGERGGLRTAAMIIGIVLAGALVLLGGVLAGRLSGPGEHPSPATNSAEAGFARDMQTHHNQAVEMSMIIYAKTGDDDIRTLSYDIATSQSQQAGQMFAWLNTWRLSQASREPSMTWMTLPTIDGASERGSGMTHVPGERMPGLATPAQLDRLRSATGTDADRIFLELMIAHHAGGVEMAEAVLDRSDEKVVRDLATGIVTVQASEIVYMQDLLAGVGGS